MALYRSWCGLSPGRVPYQAFQVPETSGRTRVVSPRFVQLAHKAGIAVQVWTVDEPDGHTTSARLGSGRHYFGQAGCCGGGCKKLGQSTVAVTGHAAADVDGQST